MKATMIEVVDLHKSFDGHEVLSGVDLVVPEGNTFVVLGVSGSGKTVLLKHVIGLLQPDQGIVRIEGEDLATLSPHEMERVRRKFGVLFQGGALFDSLTVAENLALPLREQLGLKGSEVMERIRETLALVDLSGIESKFPAELSGGMQKRVAFARAVVSRPKILLYDEPTAGLDPFTTEYVTEAILTGKRKLGMTALVITHDLTTAFEVADRVALLHEGRLIEGAPPEIFRHSNHPAVLAFLHDWLERTSQARRLASGAAA
jgi:phospholipid/cholesterol/gamma-HCH transport system ATP-binding protein